MILMFMPTNLCIAGVVRPALRERVPRRWRRLVR